MLEPYSGAPDPRSVMPYRPTPLTDRIREAELRPAPVAPVTPGRFARLVALVLSARLRVR